MFPPSLYKLIVKALGPHGPDALLAFAFFVGVFAVAPYFGFWPSAVFALVLFLLYGLRKSLHERHVEQMALADIARKQLEIQSYAARQQAKLAKRVPPAAPQTTQIAPKKHRPGR